MLLACLTLMSTAACSDGAGNLSREQAADAIDTVIWSGETTSDQPVPSTARGAAVLSARAESLHQTVMPREELEEATTSQLVFFIRTPEGQAVCPAEILVTDPQGRRTGVDPATRELLREIPGATYDEDGISVPARSPCGVPDEEELEVTPKLVIQSAPGGDYRVTVVGKAAGAYTLDIDQYPTDMRQPSRSLQPGQGTIEMGQTETFVVRIEG